MVQFPARTRDFPLFQIIKVGSWALPTHCSLGAGRFLTLRQCSSGMKLITHLHQVLRLRMNKALYASSACTETDSKYTKGSSWHTIYEVKNS